MFFISETIPLAVSFALSLNSFDSAISVGIHDFQFLKLSNMGYGIENLVSLEGRVTVLTVLMAIVMLWLLCLTFQIFGCKEKGIKKFFRICFRTVRCFREAQLPAVWAQNPTISDEGDIFYDSLDSIA